MSQPERCRLSVDGEELSVPAGVSLAAALVGAGIWGFGRHPVSGAVRGPYCGMGVCFECELEVDGRPAVRACLCEVRERMVVRTGAPR